MAQAQQIISDLALKFIRTAEHPTTDANTANIAAIKLFEYARREQVSLSDILTRTPATSSCMDAMLRKSAEAQVKSLFRELDEVKRVKANHWARICELRSQLAATKDSRKSVEFFEAKNAKIEELEAKIEELQAEIYELEMFDESGEDDIEHEVNDRVEFALKANNAEIAAMKAELDAIRVKAAADRAALAAELAKAAPISADDLAALEKKAREQQSEITTLKEALAKAKVPPDAAPAHHTPASAPAASASISKRSQGALKAWATRRAKAAASAQTAAPAPAPAPAPKARKAQARNATRETITTRVVEILKSCSGMSLDAQALGERLASDCAYQNKGYDWHNRLSDQLRTEVLSRMESMRKSGVTVISVPFGTRMTHRFVWTGKGGEGTRTKPTYSFLMSAAKFKGAREMVRGLIDPATWSVTGGRRKGVNSVRVWVADANAATAFNLAF